MSRNSFILASLLVVFICGFICLLFYKPGQECNFYVFNLTQKTTPLKLRGTVYPPKKTQTKKYVILASGMTVRNDDNILQKHYCALSQDQFTQYSYGDTIVVSSGHPLLHGRWVVHDCMDAKMKNCIDFFISRKDLKEFTRGVYEVMIEK
jgi:hypothetical protein